MTGFGDRLLRCVVGLAVCGVGIALLLRAELGAAPWDVLHQGISHHTGLPVGTVIVIVGAAVLLAWIPLRERPGLGTVLNAVLIGLTVNAVEPLLDVPDQLGARLVAVAAGIVSFGLGSGLYIGAGLGPGPRDGLMTGLARRGWSIRAARTGLELVVVIAGVALGGTIGLGTAAFALAVGPVVQWFLPRLTVHPRPAAEAMAAAEALH